MVTLLKNEEDIDVFDNIHDNGHKKSVDFANHLDSIETDDHDNIICRDTNVSSESRKRKIAHTFPQEKEKILKLPSDEVIFVDSDDELMKTHVFSPSESWQDKHEENSPREETLASVLSRIKNEGKHSQHIEALVAVSSQIELLSKEKVAALKTRVKTEMDDLCEEKKVWSCSTTN